MSNAVRIPVASARRKALNEAAPGSSLPLGLVLVGLCAVGELVAVLTNIPVATALTIVTAVVVTFRRMRAEVRALRAC